MNDDFHQRAQKYVKVINIYMINYSVFYILFTKLFLLVFSQMQEWLLSPSHLVHGVLPLVPAKECVEQDQDDRELFYIKKHSLISKLIE